MPAVKLQSLRRRFGQIEIFRGVELEIAEGEFVALLGRSGAGKTSLLRVLAGLNQGAEGRALVPRSRVVVFQEPRLLPWQHVWQNVAINLPGGAHAAKPAARAALAEVGLTKRLDVRGFNSWQASKRIRAARNRLIGLLWSSWE